MKKQTQEDFIAKAKKVHGDKYDYSKVVYKNSTTKVCIVCPEHGEFWQVPSSHLRGVGCPFCGHKSLTDEEFIVEARKIHGDKYDYSKIGLKDKSGRRCIICPEHGEFWQKRTDHIERCRGCLECSGCKKSTTEEFIEKARKIHGNKYDYSKVVYESAHKKVCIICPEHGEFWQEPDNHLRWGCKKCRVSSLEKTIREFLNGLGVFFEEQKTFDWLKYKKEMKLDFYLPDRNIAIECQGEQHFENYRFEKDDSRLRLRQSRDKKKAELCEANGVQIIYFCNKKTAETYVENAFWDLQTLKEKIYGRD